ncbi:XAC2610-related protein [Pseudomonas nitroreducens]|uniref:XAC2610-related protein n=1 Tax=Pseudomonas nitroreducens TaxID=46680 RepID=UPI0011320CD1|nr:hypothetical protein [Pseudomonas nitroreducens]
MSNEKVTGRYIYEKYNSPIMLSGNANKESIKLTEDGGLFYLRKIRGGMYGTWRNGKKTHEVKLKAASIPIREIVESVSGNSEKIVVKFYNGTSQEIAIEIAENLPRINFEDFNFDGFPDMEVLAVAGIANSSFLYYRYNQSEGRFVDSNREMGKINNPRISHTQKSVMGLSKDGCCDYKVILIEDKGESTASYDYSKGAGNLKIKSPSGKLRDEPLSESDFEIKFMRPYNLNLP